MRWRFRHLRLLRHWERKKKTRRSCIPICGSTGKSSAKRRVEEEIRGQANSSQRGRDKTPEIVRYGEIEPSATGGSGDDELLGWIQVHKSQDEGTGALRSMRELGAPHQTSQPAPNPRKMIPDPSDTYLAPQFQESFNQVAKAVMNEINRATTGRTLGRVVPSQRLNHFSNSSQRISRAIVPTGTTRGETNQRSRIVDIIKYLAVRNLFM